LKPIKSSLSNLKKDNGKVGGKPAPQEFMINGAASQQSSDQEGRIKVPSSLSLEKLNDRLNNSVDHLLFSMIDKPTSLPAINMK
jgi:hypothetical protein